MHSRARQFGKPYASAKGGTNKKEPVMKRMGALARRLGRFGTAVIVLFALPGGFDRAHAQIYQWQDDAGDHFNTSLDQVPEEHRAEARIVVPSSAASSMGEVAQENPTTSSQPNTAQTTPDNGFAAGWEEGFRAGWESGYRVAAEEQPECPAEPGLVVLQNPPVLQSPAPVVVNVPGGAYYRPPGGLVTVPFDDGATFGLTTRARIQQQRALERGW
jgi:hypothetical protein